MKEISQVASMRVQRFLKLGMKMALYIYINLCMYLPTCTTYVMRCSIWCTSGGSANSSTVVVVEDTEETTSNSRSVFSFWSAATLCG